MFALSSNPKFNSLIPQSPFLNSTKIEKNSSKIPKRKYLPKASNYKRPLRPFRFCYSAAGNELFESFRRNHIELPSVLEDNEHRLKSLCFCDKNDSNAFPNCIAKLVFYAFFLVALAFSLPVRGRSLPPAMAATAVVSEVDEKSKNGSRNERELNKNDHEYSHCTKRLLEVVSELLRTIEEVKNGNNVVSQVEVALKEVKKKKRELQDEIMEGLNIELKVLSGEKGVLLRRSEEILDRVPMEQSDVENLRSKVSSGRGEGVKDKIVKLEEGLRSDEREYNDVWERIGEIDDQIFRRETLEFSVGVRELSFIEKECEQLVKGFLREVRQSNSQR